VKNQPNPTLSKSCKKYQILPSLADLNPIQSRIWSGSDKKKISLMVGSRQALAEEKKQKLFDLT